jgi:hypothetical protein
MNLLTLNGPDDSFATHENTQFGHSSGLGDFFVLLFILVDFVFGILRNRPESADPAVERTACIESILMPEPKFHHGMRPSFEQVDHWGPLSYKITTNTPGFKDRTQRAVSLKPSKCRIGFVGDSFTE